VAATDASRSDGIVDVEHYLGLIVADNLLVRRGRSLTTSRRRAASRAALPRRGRGTGLRYAQGSFTIRGESARKRRLAYRPGCICRIVPAESMKNRRRKARSVP
jgi:hypothetical protein